MISSQSRIRQTTSRGVPCSPTLFPAGDGRGVEGRTISQPHLSCARTTSPSPSPANSKAHPPGARHTRRVAAAPTHFGERTFQRRCASKCRIRLRAPHSWRPSDLLLGSPLGPPLSRRTFHALHFQSSCISISKQSAPSRTEPHSPVACTRRAPSCIRSSPLAWLRRTPAAYLVRSTAMLLLASHLRARAGLSLSLARKRERPLSRAQTLRAMDEPPTWTIWAPPE